MENNSQKTLLEKSREDAFKKALTLESNKYHSQMRSERIKRGLAARKARLSTESSF